MTTTTTFHGETLPIDGWLNYRGNRLDSLSQRMGPSASGEIFTVTVADYDKNHDRTRLGLSITSHVMEEQVRIPLSYVAENSAGNEMGLSTLVHR